MTHVRHLGTLTFLVVIAARYQRHPSSDIRAVRARGQPTHARRLLGIGSLASEHTPLSHTLRLQRERDEYPRGAARQTLPREGVLVLRAARLAGRPTTRTGVDHA